jgi:hypothetical protein
VADPLRDEDYRLLKSLVKWAIVPDEQRARIEARLDDERVVLNEIERVAKLITDQVQPQAGS